ncbi:hypothetical protein ACNJ7E_16025 [Rhodococcus sp. NM-2]|uniref:hypothetical protein n=1 Tax=Rhodococcus sp. NM-2 TaxID=3401174 RepID=UPI003AB0D7AC
MNHPVEIEHLGWVDAAGLAGFLGNGLVRCIGFEVGRRISRRPWSPARGERRERERAAIAEPDGSVWTNLGWWR